jgi:hypothetical protein
MSNRPFDGWMLAVLNSAIKLPEGAEILNQRFEYPVRAGVAYDDDTLTVLAELPATDTATPNDTLVSIFLKDASGRLFYHGAFVIPEMTNNEPIPLASLSNLDPTGGVVLNVASIGGLTGAVNVVGQVAIDQNANALVFHGLRFKGPWDAESTFNEGDVVRYDDGLWVANRTNTGSTPAPSADWSLFLEPPPVIVPEPTGIAWKGAWQSGMVYAELDAVEYDGNGWVCVVPHSAAASNRPMDGSTYWSLFARRGIGIKWLGAWDSTKTYLKGDAVQYQGSSYYATADMPANNPPGSTQEPLPAGNVALANKGSVVGTGSTAGHGPEMAFDGDALTYWEASTGSGYFDTVGLANVWGGPLREVHSVVIRQHDTQYHHKIGSIFVEYTTNEGQTWVDAHSSALLIPNSGYGEQTVALPALVKCNGMRIKANASTTAGGSAYPWRIYELKFMANELPGSPLWDLIAQKGADGASGTSLDGLSDVDTTTTPPADGQVLKYDQASGLWKPASDSTGTGSGATTLDGLDDVTLTSPVAGQVLKFNGSAWVNDADATGTGGGATSLNDLSDVDTATSPPQEGQVLKFVSGIWVPAADSTGSGGGSEVYPQLLVSATRTITKAIAANQTTQTIVEFDNEITDVGGCYDPATGRFTAPAAGEYLVVAHVEPRRDTSGANNIGVGVSKNGGHAEWQGRYAQNGELNWQAATVIHMPFTLAQGDTLDVVVRTGQASTVQAHGTVISSINTTTFCWLKVYRLS